MAVYFIASYDLTDPGRYEEDYVPALRRTLTRAGAQVIVATGSAQTIEGDAAGQTVVLRFASESAFRAWYDSEESTRLRSVRSATTANGTAVLAGEYGEPEPAGDLG